MSRARQTACVLTAAGMLLWALPSEAYRMINPSSAGRVYAGSFATCDNAAGFAYWTSSNISWVHSTAGNGAGKGTPLQNAMNAWTNVANAGHVLSYSSSASLPSFSTNDGTNSLLWGTDANCPSTSCLALTALNVQQTAFGYRILESDILFSNHFPWNTNGSNYDVQAVAAHELGHSLGIHHTEITTTPRPTMYASYFGTDGRTLETDDRQALECSDARYLNPTYVGEHQVTNCRQISGYAYNSRVPTLNTRVEIFDGGNMIASVPANGAGHTFNYVPPSSLKNGQYHTINVRHQWNQAWLTGTSQSLICRVGIFKNQTPAEFGDTLGTSWSVGNDFFSTIPGYVTHLRYYRAAEETGVHTLKLWTTSGTFLGSVDVDFGSDLTAGWETGQLSGNGIAIQANTSYTVTVTTFTKQSKTPCGFSSSINNGPITGTGGRWVEGNGIFPTNGSCSNFWTDIYFDK